MLATWVLPQQKQYPQYRLAQSGMDANFYLFYSASAEQNRLNPSRKFRLYKESIFTQNP